VKISNKALAVIISLFIVLNTVNLALIVYSKQSVTSNVAVDSGITSACVERNVTIVPIPPQSTSAGVNFLYDVNVTIDSVCTTLRFDDNTSLFNISTTTGLINYTADLYDIGTHAIRVYVNTASHNYYDFILTVNPTAFAAPELDCDINVTDMQSVLLNWSNVTNASHYDLYYGENYTDMKNLNLNESLPASISNLSSLDQLQYTDFITNAIPKRYYRVASVKGALENISERTCGKFDINFVAGSILTFSPPVELKNASINRWLKPAQGYDASSPDTIRMFFYDSGSVQTEQKIASWFGSFGWFSFSSYPLNDVEQNIGYYAYPINNSYNATFVGLVKQPDENITFNFTAGSIKTIGVSSVLHYNLSLIQPTQGYDASSPDTARMFYYNTQILAHHRILLQKLM